MSTTLYVAAHVGVALGYLAAAVRVWRWVREDGRVPSGHMDGWLALLVMVHGAVLAWGMFRAGFLHFGFAHALSAVLWLAVCIVWLEGMLVPMQGLQLLALPLAAACAVLPAWFGGSVLTLTQHSVALRAHLLVAILAYGLLTLAALHALLMTVLDRQLHAPALGRGKIWQRLFAHVPPLLVLEAQLFRLITIGFVLLTVTVVTGVFFSEAVYGMPLRIEHKTIFTLAAWVVFGALVLGRWIFGWRGRVALRWTLSGFAMLLLAYVGVRFVLEVVLHRV